MGTSVHNHLRDADTVFNSAIEMGTSDLACPFGKDVETIALHEFGHWGVLRHTACRYSVMWPKYTGCRRQLYPYDIEAMNLNYAPDQLPGP
jgi:hypothetical protein